MNIINSKPLVSIITVTYNSSADLKESLDSLILQDYPNIESVIIDGKSADDTIDVIKDFSEKFHGSVKWISEKDNGIYDAINKGLKMSSGEIIGCLWDVYSKNDAISKIVSAILNNNCDGAHSELCYVKNNQIIRYWRTGNGYIEQGWMPAHPTLYLRRNVYDRYGMYSLKYGVYGDYEFICRCFKDKSIKIAYIPEVLIHMNYGGVSNQSIKSYADSILISTKALKDNDYRHPYLITLKRIIKTAFQFIDKLCLH